MSRDKSQSIGNCLVVGFVFVLIQHAPIRSVGPPFCPAMSILVQETPFKTFTVRELHPTFGAELVGIDFQNVSDECVREIVAAMAKVSSR